MVCSVVVGGMDHEQGETSDGRSAESEDRRGGLRQQGGIWQYDIMWITTALKLEEAAEHRAVRVFDLKIGQDVENVAQHEIEELHVRIDQLTIENDFFGQQIQKNGRAGPAGTARR